MTSDAVLEDFRKRLLRADAGVEAVVPAADALPECPEVQLAAAALFLYGQTDADQAAADGYLSRAEACGAPMDGHLGALRSLHGKRYGEAAARFEALTEKEPGDLLAMKYAEYVYYIMGQQHTGLRFRRHMERLAPANGGDPDFLASYSFSCELCGDYPEARRLAERSLELDRRNPWAEHTLSHVMMRLGEVGEGGKRLREFLPLLSASGRGIHSHTAWHLALFDVEQLNLAGAREILHGHVWGIMPDLIWEQVDAIALLWRMEMAGAGDLDEWAAVADHAEPHAGECFLPFLSAHHAHALSRAGRTAALERLRRVVRSQRDPVWTRVGVAVVEASIAAGAGEWIRAASLLDPVMGEVTAVGGSDAQVDLFRQLYATALTEGGRKADARAYLERQLAGKKASALDGYFLGRM